MTKKNIKGSKLYFNTPDSFNDPFDSASSYNISSESREKLFDIFEQQTRGKLSNDLIKEARKISGSEFNKIFKSTDYDPLHNSKRGITCFSRKNDNILMWAHYANNHQGVCLGFDIDENDKHLKKFFDESNDQKFFPKGKACRIFPMKYVSAKERPLIDMSNERKSWAEILTFKSDLWSYEKEVRIAILSFNTKTFPRTLHYQPNCFKEIICGANMKFKTFIKLKDFVEKLPNKNEISIFVATLSDTSYSLNIKKLHTESLKKITDNYFGLLSLGDNIFKHSNILKIKRSFKLSTQKIKEYWTSSVKNTLMHRIISDFKFCEFDIAKMARQGGEKPANILTEEDITLSEFMDSIAKNIKNLAYEKTSKNNRL
ncbi:MAG: DUF2971 domain-containing protein [Selenomonadaceae bacterium]|nr:DUF2971 domain-containing protein [Selenomonadaceae bacterium]